MLIVALIQAMSVKNSSLLSNRGSENAHNCTCHIQMQIKICLKHKTLKEPHRYATVLNTYPATSGSKDILILC